MRLQAANRSELPATLLEQFKRTQQQTVQTEDGQSLNGITKINPAQKSLINALELKAPTPNKINTLHWASVELELSPSRDNRKRCANTH